MKQKPLPKRDVDVVIISDVHLGAFGCHAKELLKYLRSIHPKMIILNGDIIDIWQFRKSYFPKSHLMVIRYLTGLIAKNTKVIYITGNHDELLRKFVKINVGSFKLVNKLLIDIDGKKTWIFHGDIFDITMQYSKFLTKLGSTGYDILILLNNFVNFVLTGLGKEKISFSRRVKQSVKKAVSYIGKFEETAAEIAISKGYSHVICGHIHQPEMRTIRSASGEVMYLNSGDWVENLTSLEYHQGNWRIYSYRDDMGLSDNPDSADQFESPSQKEIFTNLLEEFKLSKTDHHIGFFSN